MEGGQDLARPPVQVWRRAAAAALATQLAGVNLYSMGAGGFSTVPALPQMIRLKQPARPGRPGDVTALPNYVTHVYPTRQQIQQQFGRI